MIYLRILLLFSTVILEKPIRIPRFLSVKASHVLKGFLNKVNIAICHNFHGLSLLDLSLPRTKQAFLDPELFNEVLTNEISQV